MWVQSTADSSWVERGAPERGTTGGKGLTLTGETQQTLRGFGGTFNELGHLPLSSLPDELQDDVLRDLFSPGGCNFRFNRAPVGANDFALGWYSYDETPGDFSMEHFSVERDEQRLIPYIKAAQRHQPDFQLFASPWSPPTWLKFPAVYNYGTIIMSPAHLDAYALYFERYVRAYAGHGIRIEQLHVQNEVFADQKFPSCVWSAEQLRVFIRDHLGPRFARAGLGTAIFLGTLNGPEDMAFTAGGVRLENYSRYVDHVLFDDEARRYISGVGYQWAGQHAIARTRDCWPELELVQTESECGTGDNSWEHAEHVFHLIQHYLRHGATAYVYWNMILAPGGMSTWGWPQNSLLTVDPATGTVVRNPEYWVMRHYSSAVRPGAVRLAAGGRFSAQASAFRNPDGSIAVVVQNALDRPERFSFTDPADPGHDFTAELPARSLHTFTV